MAFRGPQVTSAGGEALVTLDTGPWLACPESWHHSAGIRGKLYHLLHVCIICYMTANTMEQKVLETAGAYMNQEPNLCAVLNAQNTLELLGNANLQVNTKLEHPATLL